MDVFIAGHQQELGKRAAQLGAELIRDALKQRPMAHIILATGTSQFEMLSSLVGEKVEWSRVIGFHLDEYLDLALDHPASFRRYLNERFISKVHPRKFHLINGEATPSEECDRLGQIILQHPIDVAFIGIGENGHLAFNDPPADFDTKIPYLVVDLDQACRIQQLNEGWFENLGDVPTQAISMSIRQILKSRHIICTVPEARKAQAVAKSLEGPVTPMVPASALQGHPRVHLFLDDESASLITRDYPA